MLVINTVKDMKLRINIESQSRAGPDHNAVNKRFKDSNQSHMSKYILRADFNESNKIYKIFIKLKA